jgi:hypothetical protein
MLSGLNLISMLTIRTQVPDTEAQEFWLSHFLDTQTVALSDFLFALTSDFQGGGFGNCRLLIENLVGTCVMLLFIARDPRRTNKVSIGQFAYFSVLCRPWTKLPQIVNFLSFNLFS